MKQPPLFVVLAAAACGGAPPSNLPAIVHEPCGPLRVVVADSASPMQRDAVSHALELWNRLGFTRLSTTDGDEIPLSFQKAAELFHGVYQPERGDIVLNELLTDPAELSVVAAHELGHAMGLIHVPESERPSVMNPGNLTLAPTVDDDGELRARCP